MVDEVSTVTTGCKRYNIASLRLTAKDVGPYIVSVGLIVGEGLCALPKTVLRRAYAVRPYDMADGFFVGNGFIRSVKPSCGILPSLLRNATLL